MLWTDQSVQEALHRVARKGSVNIPPTEENDYGLYLNGEFMEYGRAIESFNYDKTKDTISLEKKHEGEISLTALVEDFKELRCVRKTSSMFKRDLTVKECISRIGKKGTVGIPDSQINDYHLVVLNTLVTMDRDAKLSGYDLNNRVS